MTPTKELLTATESAGLAESDAAASYEKIEAQLPPASYPEVLAAAKNTFENQPILADVYQAVHTLLDIQPEAHKDFKKALGERDTWEDKYPNVADFKLALTTQRDAYLLGRFRNSELYAPLTSLIETFPAPQVLTLSAHLDAMGRELAGTITHINKLNQTLEAKDKKISGLLKDLGGRTAGLAKLSKGHRELRIQTAALKTALDLACKIHAEKDAELLNVSHELRELKNARDSLASDLDTSAYKITELELRCSELYQSMTDVQEQSLEQEALNDSLSREASQLRTALSQAQLAFESQSSGYEGILSNLRTTLEALKSDFKVCQQDNVQLQGKLDGFGQLSEEKSKLSSLNGDLIKRLKALSATHEQDLQATKASAFEDGVQSVLPQLEEAKKQGIAEGVKTTKASLNTKYREMQQQVAKLQTAMQSGKASGAASTKVKRK